ncbi:MAG: hypothetical protein ACJAZP_000796 [Psychromonas sp.]|jgi:hypothetical protein|uniref:hypothetical protein n=1 Tax=Psychromonas sp. TaxID=1884585 RepID=UPI0039E667D0
MITVDTPIGFEWNEGNSNWVKNYLIRQTPLLQKLTNGIGVDINNMNEFQFHQVCQLLETTADGRELRNKMFKAWRSKKSRDSDNGKKLYTFNLSIKAGSHLKKIAKDNPINKTLEKLIFAGKLTTDDQADKYKQKIAQLTAQNEQLVSQLAQIPLARPPAEDEIHALTNNDLLVKELAKLEKSQLIKKILLLQRKLNQS